MARRPRAAGPAAARPRGRRLPPEERRAQLLDSAAELVLADGPGALTMERLAERAGVSKGLGYVYFRDAEDVALALWDREVSEVYGRVEEAMGTAGSFEEGLARAVGAYFDVVATRGSLVGRLQAHFGGARAPRRTARRVRSFLGFWARRLEQLPGVEPRTALALAGMMVNAADAAARTWAAGALDRERAESLCVCFLRQGLRGSTHGESGRM